MAYTKRSQRWAKGAHNDGRALHVSNDEPTNKHVIARADGTAAADVRQLRVGFRREIVNLGQANALGVDSFPVTTTV